MTTCVSSGPRRRRRPPALRLLAAALSAAAAAAGPANAEPLSLHLDPALSSLAFTVSRPGETVEGRLPRSPAS